MFQRPPAPESGAFPRPNGVPQESGTFQRPNGAGVQEPGTFPAQPPQRRAHPQDPPPMRRPPQSPPPPAAGTPGTLSSRLDGLDVVPAKEDAPEPGGMASGAFPAPPRRRRRAAPPAPPEPHTEQFEPVDAEVAADPAPDAPPAGLSNWRGRPDPVAAEDTEVGVMPVVPPAPADPGDGLEATGFHDPFAADEEGDEFDAFGEAEAEHLDDYEYDTDHEPVEHEDEHTAPEPSPAKQWLAMAVQLALGVIGGAGVWLGFNWLWGKLPAAALVAAVVVIAGLVWIVRKIRRADDMQTTVLAVLVGLVVTVSPAALLLLSR